MLNYSIKNDLSFETEVAKIYSHLVTFYCMPVIIDCVIIYFTEYDTELSDFRVTKVYIPQCSFHGKNPINYLPLIVNITSNRNLTSLESGI